MNSKQPSVRRMNRQDLQSIYRYENSSHNLQSASYTRRNQVSPKLDDSPEKMNTKTFHDANHKKQLFRRTLLSLTVVAIIILLLGAIVVIALVLTRNTSSSSNGSPNQNTGTNISITVANPQLRWNATGSTVAGSRTGIPGTSLNGLDRPFGFALDATNTLYIADQQNHRVQKWLSGASIGSTIAGQASGTHGISLSDLYQPSAVLLDSNGDLYISDTSNNRVQFWPTVATSGTTVAGTLGSATSSNSDLVNPYGIARDPTSGTLYIVDQSNHRVMSYTFGATSGTVVAGGNGPGTANNQLNLPVGLYFHAASNSLYIANADSHNVVQWVIGASTGTVVAGSPIGLSGNTSTLLDYPVGITLDSFGNIYVADRNNHRIQLFLSGQTNATTIAGVMGISGTTSTLLNKPCAIALDSQLNLYVADTYNHRIQQFIRY